MGSPRPVPLTLSPISAPGRTDRTGAAGTPDSFRYRYPSHETGFPPCHPSVGWIRTEIRQFRNTKLISLLSISGLTTVLMEFTNSPLV